MDEIELSEPGFTSILESVLEKRGQFETDIDLEKCDDDEIFTENNVNEKFVKIITEKCPNLQEIDVGFQSFVRHSRIEVLMPIVDKLKRLDCDVDVQITDEDLVNKKLEFFFNIFK